MNRSKVLIAVLVMLAVLPRGVSAQSGRQEQTRKLRAVLSNYEVIRMEPSEVNARRWCMNRNWPTTNPTHRSITYQERTTMAYRARPSG